MDQYLPLIAWEPGESKGRAVIARIRPHMVGPERVLNSRWSELRKNLEGNLNQ
ncbi:MAG: hypothetical protein ACTSUE_15685 [Promethearchaeota archaeon]